MNETFRNSFHQSNFMTGCQDSVPAGDSQRLPLFVFGTLRRGEVNHDSYLAGRYVSVQPAILEGYAVVAFVMIDRKPGSTVTGELFELDPLRYDQTMAGCDELEELTPGSLVGPEYTRLRVSVTTSSGPVTAWAYAHTRTTT